MYKLYVSTHMKSIKYLSVKYTIFLTFFHSVYDSFKECTHIVEPNENRYRKVVENKCLTLDLFLKLRFTVYFLFSFFILIFIQ